MMGFYSLQCILVLILYTLWQCNATTVTNIDIEVSFRNDGSTTTTLIEGQTVQLCAIASYENSTNVNTVTVVLRYNGTDLMFSSMDNSMSILLSPINPTNCLNITAVVNDDEESTEAIEIGLLINTVTEQQAHVTLQPQTIVINVIDVEVAVQFELSANDRSLWDESVQVIPLSFTLLEENLQRMITLSIDVYDNGILRTVTLPSVQFANNSMQGALQVFNVSIDNDVYEKNARQLRVSVSSIQLEVIIVPNELIFTIEDNECVTITMEEESTAVQEGNNLTVCANLMYPSGGISQSSTIDVQFAQESSSPISYITETIIPQPDMPAPSRACISMQISPDGIYQSVRMYTFSITAPGQPRVDVMNGRATTVVTIEDTDVPIVNVERATYSVEEGGSVEICAVLAGPINGLAEGVSVQAIISVLDSSDIVDYTIGGTTDLTFTHDTITASDSVNNKACIMLMVADNNILESDRELEVKVSSPDNIFTVSMATVTIRNPLPAPLNLIITEVTSSMVAISWTPPIVNNDININQYQIAWNKSSTMILRTTTMNTYVIENLSPYQLYQISIEAFFSGTGFTSERGKKAFITATTLQDVPDGPPTALEISLSSATSLTVTWGPPDTPNGVITGYTLYVNYLNESMNDIYNTPSPSFTVPNLKPYQNVSVQVSANTSAGEGPRSESVVFTTAQGRSGKINGLTITRKNETTFIVNWNEPSTPNGVIQHYAIIVSKESDPDSVIVHNVTSVETSFTVHELNPYIPYEVSVFAVNGAGIGEPASIVEFTAEGVPKIHPQNIEIQRISSTVAQLSWTPLSLTEARGFITNYTITYWRVDSNEDDVVMTHIVKEGNSTVISGLDPGYDYMFTISASTVRGTSNQSAPVTAQSINIAPSGLPIVVIAGAGGGGAVLLIALLAILICIVCIVKRKRSASSEHKIKKEKSYVRPLKPPRNLDFVLSENNADDDEDWSREDLCKPEEKEKEVESSFNSSEDIAVLDFSGHVKEMHRDDNTGFEREYGSIKDGGHSWEAGQLPENKFKKNRFTNIFPYDYCRVKLNSTDMPGSDYINASWINGYKKDRAYIAAQGLATDCIQYNK